VLHARGVSDAGEQWPETEGEMEQAGVRGAQAADPCAERVARNDEL
jgi:hypothetical protein